jgi:hypothetical protein
MPLYSEDSVSIINYSSILYASLEFQGQIMLLLGALYATLPDEFTFLPIS